MLMDVIWRTISDGECKSMILLWILIYNDKRRLLLIQRLAAGSVKMSNYKETWINVFFIDQALWHKFFYSQALTSTKRPVNGTFSRNKSEPDKDTWR